VGTRGASPTARDVQLTGNVGVPGTGLSYSKRLSLSDTEREESTATELTSRYLIFFILVFVVGVIVGLALK
jgi:hypothetical protein